MAAAPDTPEVRAEYERLRMLRHANIVAVHQLIDLDDGFAVVMEKVEGGTVAALLEVRSRLDAGEVAAIGRDVAAALRAVHGAGMVHGDVKPSNILLRSDGTAVLGDFGATTSAGAQTLVGSAAYMDPHVARGGPDGPHRDLYALGVVCYEALSGRLPHPGNDAAAVLAAAARGRPDPLPADVPAGMGAAVARAITPEVADRFKDATALSRAVTADAAPTPPSVTAGDQGVRATRTFGPRPPQPKQRWRWHPTKAMRVGLVAVLALALAVGPPLVVWWLGTDTDDVAGDQLDVLGGSGGVIAPPDPDATPAPTPEDCPDVPEDGEEGRFIGSARVAAGECPVPVHRQGTDIIVGDQSDPDALSHFRWTSADDVLIIADLNCTGVDTPAFYRSSDGRVFAFDRWPDPEQPTQEITPYSVEAGGTPELIEDDRGCHRLSITGPEDST